MAAPSDPAARHRRTVTPQRPRRWPLHGQAPLVFPATAKQPGEMAAQILDMGRSRTATGSAAAFVAGVVGQGGGDGATWVRVGEGGQVEVAAGRWRVTIGEGSVSVTGPDRRGAAFGDTSGLHEALVPVTVGGRYAVPHHQLDSLPAGSTPLTVTLTVHIEAMLDVSGDGSVIPDQALAAAARCGVASVQKHRPRLRSVYKITADRGKTPGRPLYRYHRREWDMGRGVAYVAALVLTDPSFTHTDVAVIVGLASWSDYQGRRNPGGTRRAVGRRGRGVPATVSRTYRKLRGRGLLVGNRLRVELLTPRHHHAREDCRQDLRAATNRARRRCSRPARRAGRKSQTHTSATPLDSDTLQKKEEPSTDSPMRGALKSAPQKRRSGKETPTRNRPTRVSVPEFVELTALAGSGDWEGPPIEAIPAAAQRHGWQPAVAAHLEVEWRQQHAHLVVRNPKALARVVALCYADRCPAAANHSGPCGAVARRLHAARRSDDLDYQRRVIAAKRAHDAASPIRLRAMPEPHRPVADPRIVLLRRVIDGMEAETITRDDAIAVVDAAGLVGMLRFAMGQDHPGGGTAGSERRGTRVDKHRPPGATGSVTEGAAQAHDFSRGSSRTRGWGVLGGL